jgi:hypothetical protein
MLHLAPLKEGDEPLCGAIAPDTPEVIFCQRAEGHDGWHTAAVRPARADGTEPMLVDEDDEVVPLTVYETWPQ